MLIADLQERLRQYLRATVKSRQITQTSLAEMVGMQQAHISNFLRGRRGLSIEAMDTMLKVLGLDVETLLASEEPSSKDSATLESVPLIDYKAAMNPKFAKSEILGELKYTTVLLRRLKADPPEKRSAWVRFIAIRADLAMAAPMHPRVSNGSVLLVDRHSCSLAGHEKTEQNLYLIRKEQMLISRWAEVQGDILCLRPDSSDYPLDFVRIDRKNPLTYCLVGRVVHIATEFDRPVLGRPLLP